LAETQEVDMHRQVLHRIELELARDHPLLGAVDLELVDGGEKAPGIDALLELGVIDRDVERRLAVAVDHARHAARSTLRPARALAGARAGRRLHLLDRRHQVKSLSLRRNGRLPECRSAPRAGLIAAVAENDKEAARVRTARAVTRSRSCGRAGPGRPRRALP